MTTINLLIDVMCEITITRVFFSVSSHNIISKGFYFQRHVYHQRLLQYHWHVSSKLFVKLNPKPTLAPLAWIAGRISTPVCSAYAPVRMYKLQRVDLLRTHLGIMETGRRSRIMDIVSVHIVCVCVHDSVCIIYIYIYHVTQTMANAVNKTVFIIGFV